MLVDHILNTGNMKRNPLDDSTTGVRVTFKKALKTMDAELDWGEYHYLYARGELSIPHCSVHTIEK